MSAIYQAQNNYTGQYIAGQWRPGHAGTTLQDHNPYNQKLLTEIACASHDDLDDAYRSAAAVQRDWARLMPSERAAVMYRAVEVLDRRHSEIVDWLIAESGSTRLKAEMEWDGVRACTLAAATMPARIAGQILPIDVPGKESRVYRRPLGVIGVISPWNFPMHLSNRTIAPALAIGNGVVVKPADDTPITGGLLLASIYEEAGLPPGLLNVVVGEVSEIGDAFTLHPIPKLISFTGSTRVGRHIGELAMTGPMLKRVALELGGNAPCVVLDDANFDRAVSGAIVGRFLHQGQICMSSNRIIIENGLYDRFVDAFVERARKLKVGDPNEADTVIGPLINEKQFKAALNHIKKARAIGTRQLLGEEPSGLVLPPQVFADVANDSDLAQTELFSPIAPLIRARDEADALRLANQTEFGLSSSVFTENTERGLRFAQSIEAGMTHINDISPNDDPNTMFGGEKNSGLGRFNSDWIIQELTTDHWISVQHEPRAYPF
ncbi:aldehyde dehydrogenase family protein [Acerihabitans sp. TG2]|uniref:aldehyde dehydrogenase family protein n=1 Tax=Acerihabitans sp. TG2 TaxID=3096008 RepID=UPI002B2347B9|nr:aldehyde dehydrogenase family protein [Acerihabitans sp. TG2]MEA9391561.1 aldehyde dehydrogenase family protein [Acerihabitans sp. TG2]